MTFFFNRYVALIIIMLMSASEANSNSLDSAKSHLEQGNTRAAVDTIEVLLEQDEENAEAQYMAGLIYGQYAQEVSIFRGPGLAKKTLKSLRRAVELDPQNTNYRYALMGFYFFAPSIVGGNDDYAIEQVEAINRLDSVKGYIATANMLQHDGEQEKIASHYAHAPNSVLENMEFRLQRAMHYQARKEYKLAVEDFRTVMEMKPQNGEKIDRFLALYQLGRTGVLSGQNLDLADKAMKEFVAEAPFHYELPSKAWAKFRWAQIKHSLGELQRAKSLYAEAKEEAEDPKLRKTMKKVRKDFT